MPPLSLLHVEPANDWDREAAVIIVTITVRVEMLLPGLLLELVTGVAHRISMGQEDAMRAGYVAALLACTIPGGSAIARESRAMVVIDERTTMRDEPPPHGAIGISTAYRISDGVPGRTMEFRKRVLHVGAAIGAHPIAHDEVYYVLAGEGMVSSGEQHLPLRTGMTAYLYAGETVGIRQIGKQPLALIISYPLPAASAGVGTAPSPTINPK